MTKEENYSPEEEKKESVLDFEEAKEMTVGQATRKKEELEAGVNESDNVLDKYIKQHRQEIEAGKFETQKIRKLQEQEGPIVAQRMLSDVGIENYLIDRICYLIGHHHTYDNIEGLDYQILVEADFLVNLYEDDVNRHGIEQAYQQIFQTQTGKEIFNQMYTDER